MSVFWKRSKGLLIALLALGTILAGCGGGDSAGGSEEDSYELIWYTVGAPQKTMISSWKKSISMSKTKSALPLI
ncbi:hypothetical protein [Litoribacterium kuwaitense]|uniref:hypothetical protein n=1 Tax=Litoribacterium kuwaitense TaxID=1398745 RepID=UPI0028AB1B7F|nr:hypothetical protein [Litoribacterium kuwaitense]